MSIKGMHYDFKVKFNKIDSQSHRNLLVPEIDWLLNEAAQIFVKLVAQPRMKNHLGFETTQRTIEDIRTIVVSPDKNLDANWLPVVNNSYSLPDNYWYFIKGNVRMDKGVCKNIAARIIVRQHDDMFEESYFSKSSFEWREVNALFYNEGLKFFTDNSFIIKSVCINYIRKLEYMHNAEDYNPAGYNLPGIGMLTGFRNCELPDHTHSEIVDIAILIASGKIQASNYQLNLDKLKLNQLT